MSYLEKRMKIDALQEKINNHGPIERDIKNKINYKFRLDWNYYSNSMEGNTLTMEETRSVMVGNITVNGKPLKDIMEMQGHDSVIAEILKMGKGEARISESRIRAIHKGIMHEDDIEKQRKIGEWKTDPNYIINYKNERFDFVAPADVREKMHELLNKTNAAIDAIQQNKKGAPNPIDIAIQFHLDYVRIHPFYDGNGRTARILTNLLLISFGYPPFWIRTDERNPYAQYIADIQGYGGQPDLFFDFIAGLILRSQQIVLDALEGKDIEDDEDFLKEIKLLQNKTENAGLTKSPKIVYESFLAIKKSVWAKLSETLLHIGDLFTDNKTNHFVNDLPEEYEDRNILKSTFIAAGGPSIKKIFGYDIYDQAVDNIKWRHLIYGLKGSKTDDKFTVDLEILFFQQDYSIKLTLNDNVLCIYEKQYGDLLLDDIASATNSILKKNLLSDIKKRIA